LNYGGHVGNDAFLSLVHEARQRFLKSYNYSELNFEGVGLIMADAAIEFKKELSYADEIMISVAANGFEKYGFDLYYKLELQTQTEKVLAGKAKTGLLCFDYLNKKLVAIPKKALDNLMEVTRDDKS
jgi:YbgC/YbaW family acyl-CoA thioester hydrolase